MIKRTIAQTKSILFLLLAMMIMMIGTAWADNAWENYYNNNGEYFDRFFNKPRIMYFIPDRAAHEATLRFMASQGIRYRNQYTGKWNLP